MIKKIFIGCILILSCTNTASRHDKSKKDSVPKIELDKKVDMEKKNAFSSDSAFLEYWSIFSNCIKSGNDSLITTMSLLKIDCNDTLVTIHDFKSFQFQRIFDAELKSRLNDSSNIEFSDYEIERDSLPKYEWTKAKIVSNFIKKVVITKSNKHNDQPEIIVLEFIQTEFGYRFFGCEKFG